ncbi:hypothetical protein ACTXT7_005237 [Hymenolepis weldensis]
MKHWDNLFNNAMLKLYQDNEEHHNSPANKARSTGKGQPAQHVLAMRRIRRRLTVRGELIQATMKKNSGREIHRSKA